MKKILVVEDEYYARKSIVKILQESDLDIQVCGEAANGMKAIELLEETVHGSCRNIENSRELLCRIISR